jgi:hypothetical protein
LVSPALLTKTLKLGGIIERRVLAGEGAQDNLTQAGEGLRPWVELMGIWGQRWVRRPFAAPRKPTPGFLMWDMRRSINVERLPEERVVVRFDFRGAPKGKRSWWPDP